MLYVKQEVYEFIQALPEKDRRIISEHISRLEGMWPPDGDLERLYDCRYRMHVSRRYTLFVEHDGDVTTVLKIMSIGQAHKWYGKI